MSNSKTLKELTKNSLDKILNHSSIQNKQIKYHFGLKLYQYASGKHYDHTLDWKNDEEKKIVTDIYRGKTIRGSRPEKQFQRLLLGYQALPIQLTPLRCNISSRAANNSKKQYVKDHVIGVTSAGQYIARTLDALVSNNYKNISNIDNAIREMTENWLKDHLWLWATCRVTHDEHKQENLDRGDNRFTVDQKEKLLHYNEAGIIIEEYNN
jgi:hypothetical protein|tara:strand:- start:99 stop:728 length:630 start_codon:yes stop_codon:yes gene_type:complete